MTSKYILNRLSKLNPNFKIQGPEKIYYSGPNYTEEAIYYGKSEVYNDVTEFWFSICSWVNMDLYEFDNITAYNRHKTIPRKITFCKEITDFSTIPKRVIDKIESMAQFNSGTNVLNCYEMSEDWSDEKYLFDYGNQYFLYNRYTGE